MDCCVMNSFMKWKILKNEKFENFNYQFGKWHQKNL
jgi:hypothetical protein